jgi:L-ascorbate metabolism protein UlaG (beta-lactamase superfamily)
MLTRRLFLTAAAATTGTALIRPYAAMAAGHMADTIATAGGEISIHPVAHASFVMKTPLGTIYNDPVGGADKYADFADADLIVITHHHGDHFDPETLAALVKDQTVLIANSNVYEKLPEAIKAKTTPMANGDTGTILGVGVEAIPAYNITEDRLKYHPKGRDNGYVMTIDGLRIYIAGDTEGTPEMRALKDIDLAFVPMNLPYTMDVMQAADAVNAFAPKIVYPYHYRDSDPEMFAKHLADAGAESEVRMAPWYGDHS